MNYTLAGDHPQEAGADSPMLISFATPGESYPAPRLKPEFASSTPWLLSFRRALETPASDLSPYIEAFETAGGDGLDTGRS